MQVDSPVGFAELARTFIREFPDEAAQRLGELPANEIAQVLRAEPVRHAVPLVERLAPDLAMVLSMVAAGIAGVLVPTVLTMLGQDPAQSCSIVLTTVTDIAGFASFLGIATLLADLL